MIDLGTAIQLLDRRTKHWRLQCVNDGAERRYECQVWAAGKRFATNRRTPLEAAKVALDRLAHLQDRGGLKLVEVD